MARSSVVPLDRIVFRARPSRAGGGATSRTEDDVTLTGATHAAVHPDRSERILQNQNCPLTPGRGPSPPPPATLL